MYTMTDNVKNENENALRYPMKMLSALSDGPALPHHLFSFKKGFVVMVLHNSNAINGNGNETTYVPESKLNHLLFLQIASISQEIIKVTLPKVTC